jgi:hypothetical protein
MIMDLQNHTAWELRPQRKIATDMSAILKSAQGTANSDLLTGALPDPNNPCAAVRDFACHKLGTEDINGRHTEKWEMKDLKDNKLTTLWIDPSLPLAVKTQWEGGSGEYRNIKEGPQPESLFQVPPEYKKLQFGVQGSAR